ncbi:TetR/AcrR family transcriptional regulator [Glycomyces dulcitolivorans]|uniref:TetR/AcrR family transcriptional regulator n=1 Tax=Glycomyces dulcitolivorans TaxID=2200759 RepID=UPI000DD4715F|nr:TetR family transcriptional regulator [Glycomyces dulcitolivorans]
MAKDEVSTRDRILNALQRILVEEGSSGVTLEKVAAEAGVSKGGLLYHFKSKSDLYDGLAARFRAREEVNFLEARSQGVVETYLRDSTSPSKESAASLWALLSALRGNDELSAAARNDVLFTFDGWAKLLHENIEDPVTAEIVRLVGDGLFLSALAGVPLPSQEVVEGLVRRLKADAGES